MKIEVTEKVTISMVNLSHSFTLYTSIVPVKNDEIIMYG